MSKHTDLMDELHEARQEVKRIERRLREHRGRRFLKCTRCASKSQVRKLIFLTFMGYIPPSGCAGGDYYVACGTGWLCPKCDSENCTWFGGQNILEASFRDRKQVYRFGRKNAEDYEKMEH